MNLHQHYIGTATFFETIVSQVIERVSEIWRKSYTFNSLVVDQRTRVCAGYGEATGCQDQCSCGVAKAVGTSFQTDQCVPASEQ